jgi:hypothetical protein
MSALLALIARLAGFPEAGLLGVVVLPTSSIVGATRTFEMKLLSPRFDLRQA